MQRRRRTQAVDGESSLAWFSRWLSRKTFTGKSNDIALYRKHLLVDITYFLSDTKRQQGPINVRTDHGHKRDSRGYWNAIE